MMKDLMLMLMEMLVENEEDEVWNYLVNQVFEMKLYWIKYVMVEKGSTNDLFVDDTYIYREKMNMTNCFIHL